MKITMDKYHPVLAGIILFFIATNIMWIIEDQAPPMWDQSHYLENSEILYNTLNKKGVISLISAFADVLKTKAPLITILPIPFYLLFGNNYTSALYVNIIFLIIGSCYFYKLGTLISGKKEALASVFILNTFPLIFGLSREFLVEYGLMVFVILWMYYFLKSEGFENKRYVYPLGIVLGLGMLMKITFILYVTFPTLFVFIKRMIEIKKISKLTLRNIFLVLLTGLLISSIWYLNNFLSIIKYVISSGYGDVAQYYGHGDIFSLKTILDYWLFIINYGISAYYFFLVVILIILKFIIFVETKSVAGFNKMHFYFLIIWCALPFVIFTFGMNKDYRFTAPLYPALALLMGIAFIQLSLKKYGIVLLLLLSFPLFNYMYISFSSEPFALQIKQFIILSNRLFWAHPPVKEQWPNEKLIEFIYNDVFEEKKNYARSTLLFDHPYVNGFTLNYFSKNNNLNMIFTTNDLYLNENIDETITKIKNGSDYVITKSEKLGNYSLIKNTPTISMLNKYKVIFKKVETIPLPDQTSLIIYKRTNI